MGLKAVDVRDAEILEFTSRYAEDSAYLGWNPYGNLNVSLFLKAGIQIEWVSLRKESANCVELLNPTTACFCSVSKVCMEVVNHCLIEIPQNQIIRSGILW